MSVEKTHNFYQSLNGNPFESSTPSSNWNGRAISVSTSLLTLAAISLLAIGAQAQLYGGSWVEQECGYDYWGTVCWEKICQYEEVCANFFGFAECHIEKVCYK